MKKIIVSILAILYITASTGASVYSHFCMGDFVGTSLFSNEDHTCGKCGMEIKSSDDNGCCKDEQSFIKNGDNHVTSSGIFLPKLPATDFFQPVNFEFSLANNQPVLDHISLLYHPPDDGSQNPIYIRVRNFRI